MRFAAWSSRLRLDVAAGIALALVSNAFTPVNTDLGWTLAFARDLSQTGTFPAFNTASFTEPSHPLVMYQWGFNLLLYAAHVRWGAAGIIAIKWVLMSLTVVGIAECVRTLVCVVPQQNLWVHRSWGSGSFPSA